MKISASNLHLFSRSQLCQYKKYRTGIRVTGRPGHPTPSKCFSHSRNNVHVIAVVESSYEGRSRVSTICAGR